MNESGSIVTMDNLAEQIRILELENRMLRVALQESKANKVNESLDNTPINSAQLHLMFNSMGEGVCTIELNGNCIFINSKGLELLGYSNKEDLIGQNMDELIHYSRLNGSLLHKKNSQFINTLNSKQGTHVVSEVFWRADGTSFPCEYFCYPMLQAGVCVGAVISFIDITDRILAEQALIESEERFRRYVNSTSDIVYTLDDQQRHIGIYGDWLERLGYSKDFFIGKTVMEAMGKEAEVHEIANRSALKGQFVVYEWTKKVDGKKIYYQTALSPIYQDTNVIGLIAVGRDITRLVETRKILKSSEVQLKKLNAAKDKLFSIIAHDLYNPFNTIIGFSHLLKRSIQNKDAEKSESYLEHIQGATNNALSLLNNLLDWSKAQTGKLNFVPTQLVLADIVDEVVRSVESTAALKNIVIEHPDFSAIHVVADPGLLKTIIRNLITNAIKYTHVNGRINVTAIACDGYVEIDIADNGVGMDSATLARLFSFGMHESERGTADEKGTGLGLILCKEFVEIHGGRIWAASNLGKGSTFKFTIPIRKEEA